MIRKASYKDINKIIDLLSQVHELHFEGRPDIFKDGINKYDYSELEAMIDEDKTLIYVYTDENDEVLGYAFLQFISVWNKMLHGVKYVFIDDLCVDKEYRGKGIGKALLDYVYELSKELNYDYVRLNVWSFNKEAKEFYLKNGFGELESIMEKKVS